MGDMQTTISRHELSETPGLLETRSGIFFEMLSPRQRELFFSRFGREWVANPRIRNLVTFAPRNLAQVVYMGQFNCIFCVKVLIYFSEERQAHPTDLFYEYLEPGGYLFLGHAESVSKADGKFETRVSGDTRIYQKPAAMRRAAPVQERA